MDLQKAQALVSTILRSHVESLRDAPRDPAQAAQVALMNAEQDLWGLVNQIVEECRSQTQLEAHADEAIEITRET
jgi:hypothetical protein